MTKHLPHTVHKPSKRSSASAWLYRAAARLLGKAEKLEKIEKTEEAPLVRSGREAGRNHRPLALTRAETGLLEPFVGLPPERIHVPKTKAECEAAAREILAAGVAGFDTEAKPTFRAGEKSTGPHVVQFALTDKAYIFQLRREECVKVAADLIASERVLKVGFGLKNDHGQIRNRLGVTLHKVLDLDHTFKKKGYRGQIGVRAAMGAVLHRSFPKSKATTTSNWAAAELTARQLSYAANDAYAALKIMEELDLQKETDPRHSSRKDAKPRG